MNQDNAIPRPKTGDNAFKVFKAIVNQAGTAAPTLTKVLRNDLLQTGANPTLARSSAGVYTFTLTGAFVGNLIGVAQVEQGATGLCAKVVKTSANVVTVGVFDAAGAAADLVGNLMLSLEFWPD